jgi:hypothetical protein
MTQEPKLIYLMRNKARRCAIGSNREEDESDVDLSLEEFLSLEKLARNIKAFTEHLAHIAQDSRDEKRAGNLRKLAEGVVGVSVHPQIRRLSGVALPRLGARVY